MTTTVIVVVGATKTIGPLLRLIGFEIPSYMPFFLNPALDPMTTDVEVLSPGFSLAGKYYLFGLMAVTLFFNIITEELYFRAWMLPKLSRYGDGRGLSMASCSLSITRSS